LQDCRTRFQRFDEQYSSGFDAHVDFSDHTVGAKKIDMTPAPEAPSKVKTAAAELCLLPAVNVRMGKNVKYLVGAVSVALVAGSPCLAQITDSKACTEQERSNQTLSEKLGQTNGVICPPDIDAGMKAPTPEGGKTPVIPPPGSPGGNPNVQPK
jgi:hypothetical protein